MDCIARLAKRVSNRRLQINISRPANFSLLIQLPLGEPPVTLPGWRCACAMRFDEEQARSATSRKPTRRREG